jgi:hypothetical protein
MSRRGHANIPVQVASFDVAKSLGFTRREDNDVGREEVVRLETDDVSHTDTPPGLVLELRPDENLGESRIQITIGLMSFLSMSWAS